MTFVTIPSTPYTCKNLVRGEWRSPQSEPRSLLCPYTGESYGQVADSSADDVANTLQAAAQAFPGWRDTPIKERTKLLFRFRELVLANLDSLANASAVESGKTVAEGRAGVLKGIEVVEYALSLQNLDAGGAMQVSRGVSCQYRREPLGVVAGITPFNFPAMVPMWLFPSALTLGNCFVLKPSDKVPMTACLLGELLVEAGYPPGVVSIVHGTKDAVHALVDAPVVKAVGFVGSTPVAQSLYARACSHGKRALCLGGAKNHLLVAPDADLDVAVGGVVSSFTGCAGQRCMAASVMVAIGEVDSIIDAVVAKTRAMHLGRDMGALIDRAAVERLRAAIDDAVTHGASLRLDGRGVDAPEGYEHGYWLAPTILDNVKPGSEAATRELFGPVLSIVRVNSIEEALSLETTSEYGNAVSVFTTSGSVARRIAEGATSGMVGINVGVPVPREPFSFGGSKSSRFGAGDITGAGGVEFWSYLKKITTKWELQSDHNWMS